jgi:hypothetical protein
MIILLSDTRNYVDRGDYFNEKIYYVNANPEAWTIKQMKYQVKDPYTASEVWTLESMQTYGDMIKI